MTDLDKTKQHFLDIGIPFSSCNTLIGSTISVYPDNQREVQFEYDKHGKFLRVI